MELEPMNEKRARRRSAERISAKAKLAEAKSNKRRWLFFILLAVAAIVILIRVMS